MSLDVVDVALQKGGVGKTTVAVNVAERLAARGEDVVLADLDQQGNATEAVGCADAYGADVHLGDVIDGDVEPEEILREAGGETEFSVLPSHEDLDDVEKDLTDMPFGEARISKDVVEPLLEEYDRVVIDSPPSMGTLSDAALVAAEGVIVPILMSESSVRGLEQLVQQQLVPLRKAGVDIEIAAIVPNRLRGDNEDRRIIESVEGNEVLSEYLPEFCRSERFEESPGPGIRERIAFRRAAREGVPLASFDPSSDQLDRLDQLADVVENGGVESGGDTDA